MADIEPRIRSVLAGTPYAVQKVSHLWQIRVGHHAGARENGISLAHDLLAKYRKDPGPAAAPAQAERRAMMPTDGPATRVSPHNLEETEAALVATLDRLEKRDRTAPVPSGMFDLSMLADLVRENEPHAEALERFRANYVHLMGRLVDTRVTALSDTDRAYLNRLQAALYTGRVGAVEIIR